MNETSVAIFAALVSSLAAAVSVLLVSMGRRYSGSPGKSAHNGDDGVAKELIEHYASRDALRSAYVEGFLRGIEYRGGIAYPRDFSWPDEGMGEREHTLSFLRDIEKSLGPIPDEVIREVEAQWPRDE